MLLTQPKETKNIRFDFKTDDLEFHSSEEDFEEEELEEEEEEEYDEEEEEEFDSEAEDPVSIHNTILYTVKISIAFFNYIRKRRSI